MLGIMIEDGTGCVNRVTEGNNDEIDGTNGPIEFTQLSLDWFIMIRLLVSLLPLLIFPHSSSSFNLLHKVGNSICHYSQVTNVIDISHLRIEM
ncbi:unnamed protein product [Onchocerca flexuosa]|uniref:Transmembrane protein n=1 Tax=Onchocerca flexuosa TaxID=387005 RepID=A0A183HKZ2_9BILA|nr:unnamed protein product [Onchocerca flexuosa]